ncbi:GxxExxY protein [Psychrilyobacter piezotolerans]|uniref:GxxExxY protein n=1 Tax=Psychrilyobacter piezotolerans TaxID=2293438 RepID=A0ABX9KDS2_9FUSO|nr:GxxExxY protein [Psychrilyobacter piezotolerans]RDE59178.1 GxxExxY protein [Psychrilyobacter sp. S5]REI39740.1 GxxExxY protein [Psychrilyobacter piezotolerans]
MLLYKDLSYQVVGLAMKVHRDLGTGFLEKVYENALMILFEKNKINAEQQKYLEILYYEKNIGDYVADIVVENSIILELKTVEKITGIHIAQTMNYLKITGMKLGIILNFKNEKLEYRRVVLENN